MSRQLPEVLGYYDEVRIGDVGMLVVWFIVGR